MHSVAPLRLWALFVVIALAGLAQAQATAFTYQGRLAENGLPVTGTYDVQAALYDGDPGVMLKTATAAGTAVTNGLFTIAIDFGGGAFLGSDRWLEIRVRKAGTQDPFAALSPRQKLTPTPLAQYAYGAPWSGITGMPANFGVYQAGQGLFLGGNTFLINDNALTAKFLAADAASLNKVTAGKMAANTAGISIGHATPRGMLDIATSSAPEVDQAQTAENQTHGVGLNDVVWQSFTAGKTGMLTQVEVMIGVVTDWWTGALVIRAGEGTGGTVLTTQEYIQRPSAYAWQTIPIADPVAVTAGSVYTICFVRGSGGTLTVRQHTGDPYASGRDFYSATADMVFRTTISQQPYLLVADDGKVGIGVGPDATHRLTVRGSIKAYGLTLPTGAAAGKVLTSDASGAATWQNLPAALPPTGAAGGDLTGSYPNPTVATGAIGSSKLATDAASLAKVSGGAMSAYFGDVTTIGRVNGVRTAIGTVTNGGKVKVVDFTGVTMAQGEVHCASVAAGQSLDLWYFYRGGVLMGNYIRSYDTTAETGRFRWTVPSWYVCTANENVAAAVSFTPPGFTHLGYALGAEGIYVEATGGNIVDYRIVDSR